MERLEAAIRKITKKPLESIGFILATTLILVGLFVLSPWYYGDADPNLATKISVGIFYLVCGLPYVVRGYELTPYWIANLSTNFVFMGHFFTTLFILISFGPRPAYFLWSLTCALVALVVHVWVVKRS